MSVVHRGANRFLPENRLKHPEDFKRIMLSAKKSVDSNFLVLAKENNLGYPRLGMAISRRQVKTAVARNDIKRIIRESFRRNKSLLSGYDMVVMTRRSSKTENHKKLLQSLDYHWHRIVK